MADLGAIGYRQGTVFASPHDIALAWSGRYNPVTGVPILFSNTPVPRTESWKTLSGVVYDRDGLPCSRTVRAYERSTGRLLATTTSSSASISSSTGAYALLVPIATECEVICLDDDVSPTENDLIQRAYPSGDTAPSVVAAVGSAAGVASSSVVGGGDPYFSSVSALLHFDGTNGQTTTVEAHGRTITRHSTATISTAWSGKCGTGASSTAVGGGGWNMSASSGYEDFGSGDFTIEARFELNTLNRVQAIAHNVANGTDGGWYLSIQATNKIQFHCFNGASVLVNFQNTTTLTTGVAYYVAVKRAGSTWSIWLGTVGGGAATQENTATNSGAITTSSAVYVSVAHDINVGSRELAGYLDELRITKGVARTVSVVPTAAFPNF